MISLDKLRADIKEVTDDYEGFLYEIDVTTFAEDNRFSKQKPIPDRPPETPPKSVLVMSMFSYVGGDYFYSHEIVPRIYDHLNKKYNAEGIWFQDDGYVFDRKQYAMRSGVGKLTKPSITFHHKYGLNWKLELLFTNLEFEESVTVEESLYDNCIGCDAPCESNCPEGCRMNFTLLDWEKCANVVEGRHIFMYPERVCRICQDSCPYSEELKLKILEDHPDCGGFMQPLSYYKDYYSLGIPAEDI